MAFIVAPVQVIKRPNAPGCLANEKAVWCKVRSCNMGKFITSCAECDEFAEVNDCKKFNNFISKIFGVVFNSDRRKGIEYIKSNGREAFAANKIILDRVSLRHRN